MNPIEFNGIWKKFRKGDKIYALRDLIPSMTKEIFKGQGDAKDGLKEGEFWAVKDVSFKVKKGEVLGIVGPNGAGKSTILKLLSRLMNPNKGELKIQGRLSALIEITAGFHPDFTGRENIYFNGSIYGMTKAEIDSKYEQIVDFSGVREFIDTPVKRYSSGMSARLGFAIAAHVDPEVLLVDEVLSVGDMTFQAKCTQKMRELLKSGTTIIFISHNLSLMQSMCERIILLNKGEIIKEGTPDEVIPFYENIVFKSREEEIKKQISKTEYKVDIKKDSLVHINEIKLMDTSNNEKEVFETGETLRINMNFTTKQVKEKVVLSYEILRSDGVLCCFSNTKDDAFQVPVFDGKASVNIDIKNLRLTPSVYYTKLSIWDEDMIHPFIVKKQGIFTVEAKDLHRHLGSVYLPETDWELNKVEGETV